MRNAHMGWGVRCAVLCGLALSLSAAQHPNPATKGQQGSATHAVTNGAQNVAPPNDEKAERAHRAKYEAECDPTDEKRDGDLCAQWKAADATRDAAWWTAWGTLVSGLSGLLVLIAIGLAYQANRIARDTAKRQLRAYVHLKSAELIRCSDDSFPTDCNHPEQRFADVEIKNYGLTPARNMVSVCGVGIMPFPTPEDAKFEIPDWVDRAVSELPPSRQSGLPLEIAGSGPLHEKLTKGELAIYFWGTVTYEDVFGDSHETHIRLVSHGTGYKRGVFSVTKEGNEAD